MAFEEGTKSSDEQSAWGLGAAVELSSKGKSPNTAVPTLVHTEMP